MQIEDLQKICKSFHGVTEDIKWENHLCFNVGEKMFLITAPDKYHRLPRSRLPTKILSYCLNASAFRLRLIWPGINGYMSTTSTG
jgi:hypothetical protein